MWARTSIVRRTANHAVPDSPASLYPALGVISVNKRWAVLVEIINKEVYAYRAGWHLLPFTCWLCQLHRAGQNTVALVGHYSHADFDIFHAWVGIFGRTSCLLTIHLLPAILLSASTKKLYIYSTYSILCTLYVISIKTIFSSVLVKTKLNLSFRYKAIPLYEILKKGNCITEYQ